MVYARSNAALQITLLGTPAIIWNGAALPVPRRQTRALLYRLAAEGRAVSRAHLCALFWPDVPETAARRNLTHLLTLLRRSLPDPALLLAHSDTVALDLLRAWSDSAAFFASMPHVRTATVETLRQVAEVVRGPFLDGFSLPDCSEFEAWADNERARWERVNRELLATLTERAAAGECYDDAIWAAQRGLALDELDEALHRRLIVLYGTLGDRAAVERQYERCVIVLERELGVPNLGDEPRFRLLESVREYALERLVEHGEQSAMRQAHASYFLALVERAAPELERAEMCVWMDRLECDQDNLRAALLWAQVYDVDMMLRLVAALSWFWITRGSLSEGRTWAESALAAAGWCKPDLPIPPVAVALAGALASLGRLLFHQGECAAAPPVLDAAAAQFTQLGMPRDAVLMRRFSATALAIHGDIATASGIFAATLPVLIAIDDPTTRALAAAQQGFAALHHGDDMVAQQCLMQACADARAGGNLNLLAINLVHLGTAQLRLGDQHAAAACFTEANEAALNLKDRSLIGMARNNLGELARVRGDYPVAAEHYRASLRLLQDTDRRADLPRLFHNLGYVALRGGDTASALDQFVRSLDLFYPNNPRGVAEALDGLASVATVRGAPLTAARLWGATTTERGHSQTTAWLPDQIEHAHYAALACRACDPAMFAAAWAAGQALSLQQAVAEARALELL